MNIDMQTAGAGRVRFRAAIAGLMIVGVVAAALPSAAGLAARERAERATAHLVLRSNRDGDQDIYAVAADGRRVAALTRNSVDDGDVVRPERGRWLALQREYSELVLLSGDGRRERSLGSGEPGTFSPNGRLFAFAREDVRTETYRLFLVAVPDGRPRPLGRGYPIAFSPEGRLIAFRADNGSLGIVDPVTGRRRLLRGSASAEDFLGWSPDGARVAFKRGVEDDQGNSVDTLLVTHARRPNARPRVLVRGESLEASWLTSTQLGFTREVAGQQSMNEAGIVSAARGRTRIVARGTYLGANWSPRGDRVAYRHQIADAVFELVVSGTDGRARRVVQRASGLGTSWSPSGRRLAIIAASADNTYSDVFITDADGRRKVRVARLAHGGLEAWSPDERRLAVHVGGDVAVFSLASRGLRRVWSWPRSDRVFWVAGRLPKQAPTAVPPPRPETAAPRLLNSRGPVYELAADGPRVAAILAQSRVDCDHLAAWTAGTRRIVRFRRQAPCGEGRDYEFNLDIHGTGITWQVYYCGNDCYLVDCNADLQRPNRGVCGDEESGPERTPPRPTPPAETKRGVSIATNGGTIELRRHTDGRTRRVRPPGGAVDAELEDDGLFYAYNQRRGPIRGRIVFVPFSELFR